MRLALAAAAVAFLLPAAASAQNVDIPTAPRQRVVTVFGDEKCPRSTDPNEIVVCNRRPADEQYRIPPAVRNTPIIARRDDVSQRKHLADSTIAPTECTAVGTVGQFGCSRSGINILGAAKAAKDAVSGDITPEVQAPPQ